MTSNRVVVEKWDRDADEYRHAVTLYPDGTIEGDDAVGSLLEYLVGEIEDAGDAPEDWFPELAAALATNWNNGTYDVDIYLNG